MHCNIKNRDILIDNYLNGVLTSEEKESFDKHCFDCQECFAALQIREEMTALIKEEGPVLFAAYIKKQKKMPSSIITFFKKLIQPFFIPRYRWVTLSAGLSVAVICLFIMKSGHPPVRTDNMFETQPYLEEMISDVIRSESITILSPVIGEVLEKDIVFRWKGMNEKKLYLVILNNKAQEIYTHELEKSPYKLRRKLNPGLYYWKIESEEEMLYLGKFTIPK